MRDCQPVQIESLLRHLPLCSELSADELNRLARHTRECRVAKGRYLFKVGDACNGMHILVHGQIKLALSSAQGVEKVMDIVRPGQSFGEVALFTEKPHPVFAQALNDSLVLHLGKAAVFDELSRDHAFVRKLMSGLAQQTHQLMTDVEAQSLHTGTQRIIAYLLQELLDSGAEGDAVTLELTAGKGVIASRLSLTQEHFSRILHDLSQRQLISVEGRKIHIPSRTQLGQFQLTAS